MPGKATDTPCLFELRYNMLQGFYFFVQSGSLLQQRGDHLRVLRRMSQWRRAPPSAVRHDTAGESVQRQGRDCGDDDDPVVSHTHCDLLTGVFVVFFSFQNPFKDRSGVHCKF
jgi:hypothetical protein